MILPKTNAMMQAFFLGADSQTPEDTLEKLFDASGKMVDYACKAKFEELITPLAGGGSFDERFGAASAKAKK